ncbi:MAG: sulfotransferase [Thermodesulfobacteriota bacterium]
MTLPTFIGIGAQRAATTWAYECLQEHPQVFMAPKKEIHFFNSNFDKGIAWYESHFHGSMGFPAIGEITPNYLNNPDAIPRMAQLVPDATLFVILREPVSRAYSAYKLLHAQFKGMSFREACEFSPYLINLSLYAKDLQRLLTHYQRNRVGIFLYENVKNKPYEMLSDLFTLIGVDQEYRPKAATRVFNPIIFPKLQEYLIKAGATKPIALIKKTALGIWIKQFFTNRQHHHSLKIKLGQSDAETIDKEYRLQLKKRFHEDVLETQEIIQIDLSSWLK